MIEKQETIDKKPHNYVDNECMKCKAVAPAEGLKYQLSTDKTSYIVVGRGTCTDSKITIPSSYEGLPVTAIADKVFYKYQKSIGISSVNKKSIKKY